MGLRMVKGKPFVDLTLLPSPPADMYSIPGSHMNTITHFVE